MIAIPSVIRSTGPSTRSETSQTPRRSRRKTAPAAMKNTPATRAERLSPGSDMLDPHLPDADRRFETDPGRGARSRHRELRVDPRFLHAVHLNAAQARVRLDPHGGPLGHDDHQLPDPDPGSKVERDLDRIEVEIGQ